MKPRILLVAALTALTITPNAALALSGEEILRKLDEVEYGAKDTVAEIRMVLLSEDGSKSERKLKMFQKGEEKRLIRFLDPADVKGIGFLDAGKDKMYVYMPAFHKIRRIAGHVKNESFAGTDFSYDDLSSERFSEKFDVLNKVENADHYVLELKVKSDRDTSYSKLKVWIRTKDFMFDKVEYYDKAGSVHKVFKRSKFKLVGRYTQSFFAEMSDLKKKHSTQMIVESLQCDTGLKDRTFSKRQLKRF